MTTNTGTWNTCLKTTREQLSCDVRLVLIERQVCNRMRGSMYFLQC